MKQGQKIAAGIGLLIGLYLVLENYKGFSSDVGASTTGAATVIQKLQGR